MAQGRLGGALDASLWCAVAGFRALRHHAWTAPADPWRGISLPVHAAIEQQSQPVVVVVPEPVPSPADLVDEQVQRLGRAVAGARGVEVGEPLAPPGAQRAA